MDVKDAELLENESEETDEVDDSTETIFSDVDKFSDFVLNMHSYTF